MARGKKTDPKKAAPTPETLEQAEDTAPAQEAQEQTEDTAPAQEAQEQTEDAAPAQEAQEQTEDTAPTQEAQEQTEDTAPAVETPEQDQNQDRDAAFVKTSPEDAAAIAAQVEAGNVARLEMNENGEITLKEPERDVLAGIKNPCVYCGPTVRGVARQYTTFQGGIPDALRDFIREHPEARGLIVSTAWFPAMRKRLDTPGTAEAKLYKRVKEQIGK